MADILLGNVRGPIGPEGQTGATGETGQAATIEIGSVSTTAYGNPAQVVNSGTEEAAILDFTIPQGKPGEQTTRMGALTLDTITAQTATFPVPAVGETGSTVFGKIIKFFTDTVSALASKLNVSDVIDNLTSTATDKPLSANMGRQLNSKISTLNIVSVTRVAETKTTGITGNIILTPYKNDGKTVVFGALVNGANYAVRVWSNTAGFFYATVIDPNTGDTINNTSVELRFFVLKLINA